MKVTKLVPPHDDAICDDGKTCPAFYLTDRDVVLVQGYLPGPEVDVAVPAGEGLVSVPKVLIRALAAQFAEL